MLENMSRIRHVDRLEEEIIVDETAEYVCLMKLFPMCGESGKVPEESYRRFHQRFYIPREYFNDARKKINKILIMTNGLDEFDKYLLYDQLGTRLAALGLPTVLLPLPDHLNRHVRYRLREPDKDKIKAKPSGEIVENPIVLHDRFLQYKGELKRLRRHINWKAGAGLHDEYGCKNPEGVCSFYRHFFAEEVRVSYLGYSLGGATMLCDFLGTGKGLNACFLLNPAINLPAVNGSAMFGQDRWDSFIDDLSDVMRTYPEKDRLFEEILLGDYIRKTPKLLQENGRQLLFIFGGKDSFTSYKNAQGIMPEKWGSGMLIIPGIEHFVAENEEWKKWSTLAVKLICDFEGNAARRVITEEELDKIREEADSEVPLDERLERDEELYRATLLGTPRARDAWKAEREKVRSHRRGVAVEELPLGEMLIKEKVITFEQLWDALEEQRRSQAKIGDILVDVFKLATREQVEKSASTQRSAGAGV